MILPISAPSVSSIPAVTASESKPGVFQDLLNASINKVESDSAQATNAVQQFLSGETNDVHKVAIAGQRAELSSELFLQVRNKVISAYQEVMKLQM
jgi:flagellar hook-basal body complex protein FliE